MAAPIECTSLPLGDVKLTNHDPVAAHLHDTNVLAPIDKHSIGHHVDEMVTKADLAGRPQR